MVTRLSRARTPRVLFEETMGTHMNAFVPICLTNSRLRAESFDGDLVYVVYKKRPALPETYRENAGRIRPEAWVHLLQERHVLFRITEAAVEFRSLVFSLLARKIMPRS